MKLLVHCYVLDSRLSSSLNSEGQIGKSPLQAAPDDAKYIQVEQKQSEFPILTNLNLSLRGRGHRPLPNRIVTHRREMGIPVLSLQTL